MEALSWKAEEQSNPLVDCFQNLNRSNFNKLRTPGAPIEILYLICQDHSSCFHLSGKANLEGISFRLISDRDRNE